MAEAGGGITADGGHQRVRVRVAIGRTEGGQKRDEIRGEVSRRDAISAIKCSEHALLNTSPPSRKTTHARRAKTEA